MSAIQKPNTPKKMISRPVLQADVRCASDDPFEKDYINNPMDRPDIKGHYNNKTKIEAAHQEIARSPAILDVFGEDKRKKLKQNTSEKQLHKDLRLATTEPAILAMKALEESKKEEEKAAVEALKPSYDGENKIIFEPGPKPNLPDVDAVTEEERKAVINAAKAEVKGVQDKLTEVQKKISKREEADFKALIAESFRCVPDPENLQKYGPTTAHCPKVSRVKIELREAVAKATYQAHREVFERYISDPHRLTAALIKYHKLFRHKDFTIFALKDLKASTKAIGETNHMIKKFESAGPPSPSTGKGTNKDMATDDIFHDGAPNGTN
ncbi:uncharacterized protein AB675_9289 [Cyphellophora attinorum]|uniref:Uncharacterized protein n=1 Tax=Cyphellophora attinorum TaxID=1664694 RepID=A0A0N0NNC8_9EURO|nr:uncharacterized protein AB675_9289 [Phialophora attinorum]KPI41378.1 hypothetical protein AB675_9289 [Phialophora attinorum]